MLNVKSCLALVLMLMLVTSQAHSADFTCDTSFSDLVSEDEGVPPFFHLDLRDWLDALDDDDCALATIAEYEELADVVGVYKPGVQLNEIEIINKSAALLAALKSVLLREDFHTDNENKILALLPERITIESVKDLIFYIKEVDTDGFAAFSVGSSTDAEVDNLKSTEKACKVVDSNACLEWERFVRFFVAMKYAVEDIRESQGLLLIGKLKTRLTEYISDWDDYYENRKPQLPWELLTNEIWNREIRESNYFPRPPKTDLVFFHPQLIYTEFDSTDSEVEIESTILWEIVGINYWDNSLLTGVSLASSKLNSSDSLGILFTFKNVYSLGVFEQDDDETWFVSVDLFDFVVNKKNEFEEKLQENLEQLQ